MSTYKEKNTQQGNLLPSLRVYFLSFLDVSFVCVRSSDLYSHEIFGKMYTFKENCANIALFVLFSIQPIICCWDPESKKQRNRENIFVFLQREELKRKFRPKSCTPQYTSSTATSIKQTHTHMFSQRSPLVCTCFHKFSLTSIKILFSYSATCFDTYRYLFSHVFATFY